VFIFQFFNDEMHNYVKQNIIVHFIIQTLKNKHTFLKNIQTEKAEEPLILTEQEETKTKYFPPKQGQMSMKTAIKSSRPLVYFSKNYPNLSKKFI
jgi:phage/plasmid-associated DNA primase